MAVISLCGNVGANTGPVKCDTSRGVPALIIVGGATFGPADYATPAAFQAALLAAINKPNGSVDKLYPFPEIQNVTNNTEGLTTGTTGLGMTIPLREGKPGYTFGSIIGINLEKKLRQFNGASVPVFVFDRNGNVWGKLDADGRFSGATALLYTQGRPFGDGASVDTLYSNTSVSFESASDFFDYPAYASTKFNVGNLEGLLDFELEETDAHASNVYYVAAMMRNAKLGADINIFNTYGEELAAFGLWEAHTASGGVDADFDTVLPITAVAAREESDDFSVTFGTGYSDLPNGALIRLRLKDPGVLAAASIRGIEGQPVILTKTA